MDKQTGKFIEIMPSHVKDITEQMDDADFRSSSLIELGVSSLEVISLITRFEAVFATELSELELLDFGSMSIEQILEIPARAGGERI